jgi:hypothetical protein
MPASVALVGLGPDMHELLHSLLTDEGYAVARDGAADVALVEAGVGFAARPVVERLAAPVVLLTTALVEQVPANVRAVVPMPFEVDALLAAVAGTLAG